MKSLNIRQTKIFHKKLPTYFAQKKTDCKKPQNFSQEKIPKHVRNMYASYALFMRANKQTENTLRHVFVNFILFQV